MPRCKKTDVVKEKNTQKQTEQNEEGSNKRKKLDKKKKAGWKKVYILVSKGQAHWRILQGNYLG